MKKSKPKVKEKKNEDENFDYYHTDELKITLKIGKSE